MRIARILLQWNTLTLHVVSFHMEAPYTQLALTMMLRILISLDHTVSVCVCGFVCMFAHLLLFMNVVMKRKRTHTHTHTKRQKTTFIMCSMMCIESEWATHTAEVHTMTIWSKYIYEYGFCLAYVWHCTHNTQHTSEIVHRALYKRLHQFLYIHCDLWMSTPSPILYTQYNTQYIYDECIK